MGSGRKLGIIHIYIYIYMYISRDSLWSERDRLNIEDLPRIQSFFGP